MFTILRAFIIFFQRIFFKKKSQVKAQMYKIEMYQKLDRKFDVNELKDPLTGNLLFLSGHKWRNVKLSPKFTTGKL